MFNIFCLDCFGPLHGREIFACVYRGYPVCCKLEIPQQAPTTDEDLKHLETLHQVSILKAVYKLQTSCSFACEPNLYLFLHALILFTGCIIMAMVINEI